MKRDVRTLLAASSSIVGHAALLGALLGWLTLVPAAADNPSTSPTSSSQPQFGGQCAEGLAQGKHVATNCSVTWTDKDGKVYCFSSEAAKKSFLQDPTGNLQKAHEFVAASNVDATEKAMQNYTSSDAETVVKSLIDEKSKANNGAFPLEDPLNGEQLKLAFDGIDFTRTIDGYGFFPDVKFHDQADANKH
jgi:YHS domain-containing protein